MTAKEYLLQARFLDTRINAKIKQLEALNDLATSATATLTGMPRDPNKAKSKLADTVVKIVDLQHEINDDIDRLVDLKREIRTVIESIADQEQQTILEKRYLCFQSWEQISVDMGYAARHMFRLHDYALTKIKIPERCQ